MRVANPFALSGPTRVRNRMAMAYVGRCDEPLRLDCDRILSPMKAAAPSNAEVLIANARTWTDFALVRRSGANIRPDRSCRREPVDMADEDLVRGHDSPCPHQGDAALVSIGPPYRRCSRLGVSFAVRRKWRSRPVAVLRLKDWMAAKLSSPNGRAQPIRQRAWQQNGKQIGRMGSGNHRWNATR